MDDQDGTWPHALRTPEALTNKSVLKKDVPTLEKAQDMRSNTHR